jgi:formylglycine-generating enzyme required for sulfatase activity
MMHARSSRRLAFALVMAAGTLTCPEVTQEHDEKLIKENPSRFQGARNPVEMVSWDDARKFCEKLGQKASRTIRLPSESEWEYACRAGTKTPFSSPAPLTNEQRRRAAELIPQLASDKFTVREKATRDLIHMGKGILPMLDEVKADDPEVQSRLAAIQAALQPKSDLDRVAWYCENSDKKPHPSGEKEPTIFGLYDMHGNVAEWCEDDRHGSYDGAPNEGSPWVDKTRAYARVVRGGSWLNDPGYCRSTFRNYLQPESRLHSVGFRVAVLSSSPRTP